MVGMGQDWATLIEIGKTRHPLYRSLWVNILQSSGYREGVALNISVDCG